jgi:hypothetical protein
MPWILLNLTLLLWAIMESAASPESAVYNNKRNHEDLTWPSGII